MSRFFLAHRHSLARDYIPLDHSTCLSFSTRDVSFIPTGAPASQLFEPRGGSVAIPHDNMLYMCSFFGRKKLNLNFYAIRPFGLALDPAPIQIGRNDRKQEAFWFPSFSLSK